MTRVQPSTSPAIVRSFLMKNPTVQFIRLTFVLYSNVHKVIIITPTRALEMARDPSPLNGLSVNPSQLYNSIPFGPCKGLEEKSCTDYIVPDWRTIRLFACSATTSDTGRIHSHRHAVVLCHIWEAAAAPDKHFACDPRSVLQSMEVKAKDQGLSFTVGYEIDFTLLPIDIIESGSDSSPPEFRDLEEGAMAAALLAPSFLVLEACVAALEASGIHVWRAQPRSTINTHEISLGPRSPCDAADTLVVSVDIIKNIAAKHGWHATQHPRPYEGGPTSAQHVTFSISNPDLVEHALAGLLKYLAPLRTFLNAGYDSYGCREGEFGGAFVGWTKWKKAPIRLVGDKLEMRIADGLANPHIQLAAILGIALKGIDLQLPLTITESQHSSMNQESAQLLPASLEASLAALQEVTAYETFGDILGEHCLNAYLKVKENEVQVGTITNSASRRRKTMIHI